jgi:hypothetical protein
MFGHDVAASFQFLRGATTRAAPRDTLSENECRPSFQVALTTAAKRAKNPQFRVQNHL